MNPHLCIITQNHLCRNPRVLKEARLAFEQGYKVTILTTFYDEALYLQDISLLQPYAINYLAYTDLRLNKPNRNIYRLAFKIGRELIFKLGIENAWANGYGPWNIIPAARKQAADLYSIHQEMPSVQARFLLNAKIPVAFDLEDWYSEDLRPSQQLGRPKKMLAKAESDALTKGVFSITTSHILAEELFKKYKGKKPIPIYNSFPLTERSKLNYQNNYPTLDTIKLIWISQVTGPGRGIENMLLALSSINATLQFNITLVGKCDPNYQKQLLSLTSEKIKIIFKDPVPPPEILPLLASHHIGLATELAESHSRDLTITNKILHYLLAGLPVLASFTQGHNEIKQLAPEAIIINHSFDQLAAEIPLLIQEYSIRRNAAWIAGENLCWENQATQLIQLWKKYLSHA
jgi:hypothetical protein